MYIQLYLVQVVQPLNCRIFRPQRSSLIAAKMYTFQDGEENQIQDLERAIHTACPLPLMRLKPNQMFPEVTFTFLCLRKMGLLNYMVHSLARKTLRKASIIH